MKNATQNNIEPFSLARRVAVTLIGLFAFAALALPALAQVGGGFDLSWNTVDGGGYTSSSAGSFGLGGTIGQPDAGAMSGGTFGVQGGFWGPDTAPAAPPSLVGHVTWQGRPAQPSNLQQLPITLTLKSASTEVNFPVQTTDASGYFTVDVSSLVAGTYNWRVKSAQVGPTPQQYNPGFLATSGTLVLTGGAITNQEMGLQRAGDADNNNVVNAVDFTMLKTTFGKTTGMLGYDNRADFTGDTVISVADFNLLKNSFGMGGAPPIEPGNP